MNSMSCRDGGGGESQPGLPRIDSSNTATGIHIYFCHTRLFVVQHKIAMVEQQRQSPEHRMNRMNRVRIGGFVGAFAAVWTTLTFEMRGNR